MWRCVEWRWAVLSLALLSTGRPSWYMVRSLSEGVEAGRRLGRQGHVRNLGACCGTMCVLQQGAVMMSEVSRVVRERERERDLLYCHDLSELQRGGPPRAL